MNTIGISTPNAAGLVGEAAIEGGSRPQGEIHAGKAGILGTDSLKVVEMGDVNQLVETL